MKKIHTHYKKLRKIIIKNSLSYFLQEWEQFIPVISIIVLLKYYGRLSNEALSKKAQI